jgi:hypothetical protein
MKWQMGFNWAFKVLSLVIESFTNRRDGLVFPPTLDLSS